MNEITKLEIVIYYEFLHFCNFAYNGLQFFMDKATVFDYIVTQKFTQSLKGVNFYSILFAGISNMCKKIPFRKSSHILCVKHKIQQYYILVEIINMLSSMCILHYSIFLKNYP